MKLQIIIDIDPEESGYSSEDVLKDNVVEFARDLIVNGADNMQIVLSIKEVSYFC